MCLQMSIWEERKVFGQRDINDLRKGPHASGATESQPSKKSIYDDANAAATKPAAAATKPAAAATKPAAAASVLSNTKQQVGMMDVVGGFVLVWCSAPVKTI